jgi:DNA-binding GntR family transcriptional regulator
METESSTYGSRDTASDPDEPASGRVDTGAGRGGQRERRGVLAPAESLAAISTLDALVESLRARVLEGEFAPRTVLAEMEVAEAYGVARPTARAAIQRLVFDQVLRREPNRSAHVPELTHDDVRDLYSVRTPLELMVVEQIIDRGLSLANAEQAMKRLERLSRSAPWADVVDLDGVFHMALVTAVESPRLTRIYESLQAEIRLALLQLGSTHQSPTEAATLHRELFTALSIGPKQRALDAMKRHLDSAVIDLTGDDT